MYQKNSRAALVQRPQKPTMSGLGAQKPNPKFQIPSHLSGKLGFLGGQIQDPFEQISRADWRKRKAWRRDYLAYMDELQVEDLSQQFKGIRVRDPSSGLMPKKKKATKTDKTDQMHPISAQTILEKGQADDNAKADPTSTTAKKSSETETKKTGPSKTAAGKMLLNNQLALGAGILQLHGAELRKQENAQNGLIS